MQHGRTCLRCLAGRLQSASPTAFCEQGWSVQAARAHTVEAVVKNQRVRVLAWGVAAHSATHLVVQNAWARGERAQEEEAVRKLNKMSLLDNLAKDANDHFRRIPPAKQRVLDAKETAKRLEKKRFNAYLKLIEDRKQQCARLPPPLFPALSWLLICRSRL